MEAGYHPSPVQDSREWRNKLYPWMERMALSNPPEPDCMDLTEDQSQILQSRGPQRKLVAENGCFSHLHYTDGKPEALKR